MTWFGSLDGAFGYVIPISGNHLSRLNSMLPLLARDFMNYAGLNPRASRTVRLQRRELCNPIRCVSDGDLAFTFTDLSLNEKAVIANKLRVKIGDVMDDLAEIERMAAHF